MKTVLKISEMVLKPASLGFILLLVCLFAFLLKAKTVAITLLVVSFFIFAVSSLIAIIKGFYILGETDDL